MAGLVSGSKDKTSNIALFDNLIIKQVKSIPPDSDAYSNKVKPMYNPDVKNNR
jgi:hypothetical protein